MQVLSTQCSSGVASQCTAHAAVQTDYHDVITKLGEQIQVVERVIPSINTTWRQLIPQNHCLMNSSQMLGWIHYPLLE